MSIIQENHDLKNLNWWKVGGVARYFAAPTTIDDLKTAVKFALGKKLQQWVISGGSNVLIKDGTVEGLVISMHGLHSVEKVDMPTEIGKEATITALAGTPKGEVSKVFIHNKLAPAIFLTGIPGDMGAGVVMNAGIGEMRTPREFCEIVKSVEVLRLKSEKVNPTDVVLRSDDTFNEIQVSGQHIKWEYRHSSGWQPGLITRVTVGCAYNPDKAVLDDVRAQTKKRVSTQPLDLPNCGSVFRNPLGHKSAQLIEGCGLKGFRVGGASVSMKHANFIVNDKGASSADVDAVIKHVRKTVQEQKGIELVAEVVYIG